LLDKFLGDIIVIISKSKSLEEALFYINKTIENNWSRSVLMHQIELDFFKRQGKAIEFKAEFTGKMNLYLSAVDDTLKTENENPTIGILLCKSKSKVIAEYALRGMTQPIGIAEYEIGKAIPKELKGELPTIEEKSNINNLHNIDGSFESYKQLIELYHNNKDVDFSTISISLHQWFAANMSAALDKFMLQKKGKKWDGVPIPNVSVDDLKNETFEFYLKQYNLNDRQTKALLQWKTEKEITNSIYSEKFNISERTALRDLSELVEKWLLNKIGDKKNTKYIYKI